MRFNDMIEPVNGLGIPGVTAFISNGNLASSHQCSI